MIGYNWNGEKSEEAFWKGKISYHCISQKIVFMSLWLSYRIWHSLWQCDTVNGVYVFLNIELLKETFEKGWKLHTVCNILKRYCNKQRWDWFESYWLIICHISYDITSCDIWNKIATKMFNKNTVTIPTTKYHFQKLFVKSINHNFTTFYTKYLRDTLILNILILFCPLDSQPRDWMKMMMMSWSKSKFKYGW